MATFLHSREESCGAPRFSLLLLHLGTILLAFAAFGSISVQAQDAAYFKQNCQGCHTIGGGRLVGPDLKDVSQRAERAWLVNFIQDPKAVIDSGDPYAAKLLKDAGGMMMSQVPGMTKEKAEALLDLIDFESTLEKSQFKGIQISERPFVPEDVQAGRDIFLGSQALINGGPSCNSCHTLNTLNFLHGGTLGPDLSQVFGRLGGRKALSGWLVSPGSVTMTPVYANNGLESDEILALVAFLKDAQDAGGTDTSASRANFVMIGLICAGLLLALFDIIWKNRFTSVRKKLVHAVETGERT